MKMIIDAQMVFTSYISPAGVRMVNPVLVDRQLQEMRRVMKRIRQKQFAEEQSMTHLHELANRINIVGQKAIFAKKKVNEIRVVSKRMQAVHETSNPLIRQKLNKIRSEV